MKIGLALYIDKTWHGIKSQAIRPLGGLFAQAGMHYVNKTRQIDLVMIRD